MELEEFVRILRLAYSGELAAAHAYRGHWRSASGEARVRIRQIEEEEWRHRQLVGKMLRKLGQKPSAIREIRAYVVGRLLGLLCRVCGSLLPLYAAGMLESKNIREYEDAARYAVLCGCVEFTECLLCMAEVEWDHEKFFRSSVLADARGSKLRLWSPPAGRQQIRLSFEKFLVEKISEN